MKFVIVLFLMVLAFFDVNSQNDLDIYFTVQVAAAKYPIPKTSRFYSDMPNLEEIKYEDGMYRYFTGNFMTYHFAQDYLKKVNAMGYEDAFILAIMEGKKRLSVEEATELIYGD